MLYKKTLLASIFLGSLSFCLASTLHWNNSSVQAIELQDGKTYFLQPPTLVDAYTTINVINSWSAIYYYTIQTAANAGVPLQSVAIAQTQGGDTVEFRIGATTTYTQDAGGDRTQIQSKTTLNPETNTLSIVFDPPVPPGKAVVIRLLPSSNPRFPGVYLFGVTAFPPGAKPFGQFLGYGRLSFFSPRR
ncbi:MAG: hypothetical protein DCF20_02050 [Pseudanabaena sp.]|nr:MAG: hypothetical protein DCF20_02050 [Pseudanabaena sp.]